MGQFTRGLSALLVLVAAMINFGCTASRSDNSKISLAIPSEVPNRASQIGMLAQKGGWVLQDSDSVRARSVTTMNAKVDYVAINVSGAGIASPITLFWERNDDGDSVPVSFAVDVPRGRARLIQVLVAAEDDSGKIIYYGDNTKDLVEVNESATVDLAAFAPDFGEEYDIEGRFLRADGTGPNGLVNVMMAPATGKPAMIVMRERIFAGWFSLFGSPSVNFRYVLQETGENLFPQGIAGAFLQAQPNRNAVVIIPPSFRPRYSTSDQTDVEPLELRKLYAGFFGAPEATSNRQLCYKAVDEDLQDVWSDQSKANKTLWRGTAAPAANQAGIEPAGAANLRGGRADSDVACVATATVQPYRDFIPVNHQGIRNGDKLLGFQGPFRIVDFSNWSYANATHSGNAVSLSWAYLPGVTQQKAIDGVTIFSRVGYPNNNDDDFRGASDGYQCDKASQISGIVNNGDVPVEAATVMGVATATVPNVDSTNWSQNKVQFLICPYKNFSDRRVYFPQALYPYLHHGNNNNGNVNQNPATKLAALSHLNSATTSSTRAAIQENSCYPIEIKALTDSDVAQFPGGVNLQVTSSNASDLLFTDPSCSQPVGATNSLSRPGFDFNNDKLIYLKSSRSNGSVGQVDVTVSSGPSLAGTSFHYQMATPTTANRLETIFEAPSLYAWSCEVVTFRVIDTSAGGQLASGPPGVQFAFSALAGLQFFDEWDSSCSNSPVGGSFSFPTNTSMRRYRVRYSGSLDAAVVALAPTVSSGTFSGIELKNTNVYQPGLPSTISLYVNDNQSAQSCVYMDVQVRDSNGRPTSPTVPLNLGFSATNGGQFRLPGCNTSSSTATIPAGSTRTSTLSFFPPTGGGLLDHRDARPRHGKSYGQH